MEHGNGGEALVLKREFNHRIPPANMHLETH